MLVGAFYVGKKFYLKPRLEQGIEAYEIEGNLADGSDFKLSELKGKYVLLDFWGSWCKPCRESHPELTRLYQEFHGVIFKDADGFEIVSFGVERNSDKWKEAIMADSLSWPYHLVSLNLFTSPIVEAYNVKQIPTKFLINSSGIIIAVDPSLEQISQLLRDRRKT